MIDWIANHILKWLSRISIPKTTLVCTGFFSGGVDFWAANLFNCFFGRFTPFRTFCRYVIFWRKSMNFMQFCNQKVNFSTINLQFACFVLSKLSINGINMFPGMNNIRLNRTRLKSLKSYLVSRLKNSSEDLLKI